MTKSCIQRYFVLESNWNDSATHFGAHPLWDDFMHVVLWEMSVHLFLCFTGFLGE